MTVAYLDTSAALKLLVEEAESEALVESLTAAPDLRLVSSWLLHTELRSAAGRHPEAVEPAGVRDLLDTVDLVDLTRGDLVAAGGHSALRSLVAIHLAVAARLAVDEVVTYDRELATATVRLGLAVSAPGG